MPFCNPGLDADGASREPDPLGDAHEPQTLAPLERAGDIEPLAIIRDRDLRVVAGAEQSNVGPAGAGVRDDVAQRFLRDPVQAERGLRSDGREVPFRAARQRHAVRTLELGTVGGQGGHQPRVPEHGGMQVVREMADVLGERGGALLEVPAGPPADPRRPATRPIAA